MLGTSSPEKKSFWLFYLNERIFPLGWAEQKGIHLKHNICIYLKLYIMLTGLPWRVMNLETNFVDNTESHLLLNVLKVILIYMCVCVYACYKYESYIKISINYIKLHKLVLLIKILN